MSLSTMLQEMRDDMKVPISKVRTETINEWKYTYIEVAQGLKVGVTNPNGVFSGYFMLPGRKNPSLSPNL